MSVTSARPGDLAEFEGRSGRLRVELEELRSRAASMSSAVRAASADFYPEASNVGSVAVLLGTLLHTERYAGAVRQALVEADRHSGQPVVDDSVLLSALRRGGVQARPAAVTVQEMSVFGLAPTSGFVDDPICAANGNFVHVDEDLAFPGFAACLAVSRTYNSLAHGVRRVFGPGWSCLLDMRLSVADEDAPVVFLADGAALTLFRDNDEEGSGYLPDQRRRLGLVRVGEGWELRGQEESVWEFDAAGVLVGLRRDAAQVVVERRVGEVRLREVLSGRWVSYVLTDGRVAAAHASDGRLCRYGYDADGHLVAVERPAGDLSYVVQAGLVVSVVDADGVVLCVNGYDEAGRVLRQGSPHGRTSVYEYDELGATRVSDNEGGPVNVLVHERHGNLTSMIDGHGNDMRLRYDADGRVVRLVDRLGQPTRYEYTDAGRLARRVDPDGAASAWAWDELGRVVSQIDRAGRTTIYQYAGTARTPTRVVGPDGAVIETGLDERGLPVQVTDADAVVTRFGWTADGQLASAEDALGNRHEFDYDERGALVQVRDPSGVEARLTVDAAGRVVQALTADGLQRFTYTAAGRLTEWVETDGGAWRFGYGPSGDVERLTDPAGAVLRLGRDTHGNLTTFVAPDGAVYRHEYDELCRLVAVVDPAGNTTRLEYDAEGRSVAMTDPSGRRWSREVDALGRTVSVTAPDRATSRQSYHPGGELAELTDAEGRTWQYTVDAVGRRVRTVDPAGARHEYAYSAAGRPLQETTPAGRSVQRSYDEAGRLVEMVDRGRASAFLLRPDGQVGRWEQDGAQFVAGYDELGRLTSVRGPGVEVVQRWAHGRLVEAGTSSGRSAFEWDTRGCLAAVTDPAGVSTALSWDSRGRLVGQVTADSAVAAQFDEVGYLRQVFDALGQHTDLDADPAGRTRQVDLPDGRSLRYAHTALGLPETVSTGDGTLLARFGYDATGALVQAATGAVTTRVERDPVGRVSAVRGPGYELAYGRDLDGLVLSLTDDSGFHIDLDRSQNGELQGFRLPDGQVVDPPEREVARDDAGRIVRDELDRHYDYDSAGRLVQSTTADGRLTTYGYGPTGLLETQHDDSGEQRYRYNQAGQLLQRTGPDLRIDYAYDPTGRRTRQDHTDGSSVEYAWDALDRLTTITRRDADGGTHVHDISYDAFGCPVLIDGVPVAWDLAETGKAVRVGNGRYLRDGLHVRPVEPDASWQPPLPDDPWGDDGGTGVRLGYRGELAVDGLVLIGARVYDPASRQFLSPDPAAPVAGALAFAGPYTYAANDPVNHIDPTGLRPLTEADYDQLRQRQNTGLLEQARDFVQDNPWTLLATSQAAQLRNTLIAAADSIANKISTTATNAARHALTGITTLTSHLGRLNPTQLLRDGVNWLADKGHQVADQYTSFLKGFWVDGVWGTVKGLGNLVGLGGWDTFKESWKGLAKFGAALNVPLQVINHFWALPGLKRGELFDILRGAGKSLVAWDEWQRDPARAAGATAFNILSLIAPMKSTKVTAGVGGTTALPEDDGSPTTVAAWWRGLTPEERAQILEAKPELIGSLDGLPATARDMANRRLLDQDLALLGAREAAGTLTDPERKALDNARATSQQLAAIAARQDPRDPVPLTAQLYDYDPNAFGGDGKTVLSIGNLDTAQHVAINVPGFSTTVSGSLSGNVENAGDLYTEARFAAPSASVATVVWIGYDAPSDLDSGGVAVEAKARVGGALLAQDLEGLRASRAGSPTHLTVIGHSYGSTTVSHGAANRGLSADELVLIGSPGAGSGNDHASDLRMDPSRVYVGSASTDYVTYLGANGWVNAENVPVLGLRVGMGNDPAEDDFGARRFQAELMDRSQHPTVADHTNYYRRGSESLYNMANVVVGKGDSVTPAGHRRDPWWRTVDEPEEDRLPSELRHGR